MKKKFTISSFSHIFFALLFVCVIIFSGGSNKTYATGTVFIYQDMENPQFPPAGWTLANTVGYNWIRTTYSSGFGIGTACATCDFYDYPAGTIDMVTKVFTATTAGDSVAFDHAYAHDSNGDNDQLSVYVSSNGGSTWTLLANLQGSTLTTGPATDNLFMPTPSQWAHNNYVLPVGTNMIKFEGISAFGNNLYLDNIKIGTPYSIDVGVTSISAPKWGINPGSVAPVAIVRNFGTTTQSFTVTMTATGGYTNTQNVTNLAPGANQSVTFASNNFAAGNVVLSAYTNLASDLNHSNDTITNNLVVTTSLRNIVLEFETGTWCQWCPCGDRQVDTLAHYFPQSVILAYHGPSGSDPYGGFNDNAVMTLLGLGGLYPDGLVDRRLGSNNGWGAFFIDGEYRYSSAPAGNVSIVIDTITYNTSTRLLSFWLKATALSTLTGQYNISNIITEDNLTYTQTGNSYCSGGSWTYDWVARNMVNNSSGSGTVITTGPWNSGQSFYIHDTTTISSGWVAANCKLNVIVFYGSGTLSTSVVQQGTTSSYVGPNGISGHSKYVPTSYELEQNYPNPFNPTTNFHFSIPKDGNVTVKIYDVTGQVVGTFVDGFLKAGTYNAEFDGTNYASGVYFYTLSTPEFTQTKKMILLK